NKEKGTSCFFVFSFLFFVFSWVWKSAGATNKPHHISLNDSLLSLSSIVFRPRAAFFRPELPSQPPFSRARVARNIFVFSLFFLCFFFVFLVFCCLFSMFFIFFFPSFVFKETKIVIFW